MAGIDLATATARLDAYLAAELAVLAGQSYTIEGRTLTRANLADIRKGVEYWNMWAKRLGARASGRSAAISPRPGF